MGNERKSVLRDEGKARAQHDIGGLDFGPIDRSEHDLALWEKRVDAMMILLYARKSLWTVDAMRRTIEDYARQTYDDTEYYEKWVLAMRNLLVEQEIMTRGEVEAEMGAVAGEHIARGREVEKFTLEW